METISGYELKEFNRVYKEMDDLYHEIALKLGLSDSAFIILYALCEQGNGCLQKDICAQAFVSKQTINSSIRRLEKKGILFLEPGKGRDMHICLNEMGRQFVQEKIVPVVQMENSVFSGMSPIESAELLRLNRKYLEQFREKVGAFLNGTAKRP